VNIKLHESDKAVSNSWEVEVGDRKLTFHSEQEAANYAEILQRRLDESYSSWPKIGNEREAE
jgi:hypothetical protein